MSGQFDASDTLSPGRDTVDEKNSSFSFMVSCPSAHSVVAVLKLSWFAYLFYVQKL